tara:strand:- start:1455 stop:1991 length:537 start_codon:yes stop_codon:yes gene_type:complete
MILQRNNDELKADRPTLDENKSIPKIPVSFLLENIRSVHNVGSVFRTGDGIGCEKIYLTGYTAFPPRQDLSKVALGAENAVQWEQFNDPIEAVKKIKQNNIKILALEQTYSSKSIYEYNWNFPVCIILGNEVKGISEKLLQLSDDSIEIPMRGIKQSLNVSVAAGVIGYEILNSFSKL